MSKIPKRRYLYSMMAGFGAISLSVLFFFLVAGLSILQLRMTRDKEVAA